MSARKATAISVFCAFHMVAILWWNVVSLGPPVPTTERGATLHRAWANVSSTIRGTAVGATTNTVLGSYVRLAGLWQQWFLFAPDPPRYAPKIRIFGVREVAGGVALDPDPLFELDDVALDDHRLLLASPPCGFEVSDDPRAHFLAGAFTRYVVRERVGATGYVGARLTCTVWPIPGPSGGPAAFEGPGQDIVLWEGPL